MSPQKSNSSEDLGFSNHLAVRLPLTDKFIDHPLLCKLCANAQTREKCLKILQYTSKLIAYFLQKGGKEWEALAKLLSTARRCFKLLRWVKHFDDLKDAAAEGSASFRSALYLDVGCNLVADISEDMCSLEKIGFIRKGRLPARAEYYSNWCQLVLAVVEIYVSKVKAERAVWKANSSPSIDNQRKSLLARLEMSKFVADLFKAFWDCELSFANELLFILSGLWAAMVSTHKYAIKAAK